MGVSVSSPLVDGECEILVKALGLTTVCDGLLEGVTEFVCDVLPLAEEDSANVPVTVGVKEYTLTLAVDDSS